MESGEEGRAKADGVRDDVCIVQDWGDTCELGPFNSVIFDDFHSL